MRTLAEPDLYFRLRKAPAQQADATSGFSITCRLTFYLGNPAYYLPDDIKLACKAQREGISRYVQATKYAARHVRPTNA